KDPAYKDNSLFQDKLLWIARYYRSQGISYVEISDTALVKKKDAGRVLKEIHEVMEKIYEETHVRIRFLAALRRIPLTIVRENIAGEDYLQENLDTLAAVAKDPYVAGSDIVGEEINDIRELTPLIEEITRIAVKNPGFVILIHAGENDSLRGNVINALQLIQSSLKKGEKMPYVRIGHGLYTPSLHSEKGRQLLKLLKENDVVLEFQITSNVRLNNLNHLSSHPLKKYLKEGIHCVEGSDGAALYGSSSIDEQLSLEKLLKLSHEDLLAMRKVEEEVEKTSKKIFERKMKVFLKECGDQDVEAFYRKKIEDTLIPLSMPKKELYSSYTLFPNKVAPFPEEGTPLIIAGGSFNHDKRTTRTNREMRELIDELLEKCDPDKVFFVIGHSFSGYERYLLDHNDGRFMIFSYVPALISRREKKLIESHPVHLRVSTEIIGMSLYKSFNYEIFERRPSLLLALDGNSAGANLIQEARNGKAASRIFVYSHSPLKEKALSLKGYATLFSKKEEVLETILQAVK
ncbi:MAG: hypothetical protein IIZ33_07390, partial [Erysipelotrichaceae bacterium]|nr:hypothetical protein [Erysipelotrichaceae bacterium]